jgi:hypothetical protein
VFVPFAVIAQKVWVDSFERNRRGGFLYRQGEKE